MRGRLRFGSESSAKVRNFAARRSISTNPVRRKASDRSQSWQGRVTFAISILAFAISAATFYVAVIYEREDAIIRVIEHDEREKTPKAGDDYSLYRFSVANNGTKPLALTHAAVALWMPQQGDNAAHWSPVYINELGSPFDKYVFTPLLLKPGDIAIVTAVNNDAPSHMFLIRETRQ
jgi:hypothetical protein